MPPQKKMDAGGFRPTKITTGVGVEGVNRYPHRPTCLESYGSNFMESEKEELYRKNINKEKPNKPQL